MRANQLDNTLTVLTNSGSGTFGFNATLNVGTNPINLALIRLNADATTSTPLVAHSGSTTAAALYLRADGGVEATRWLHVGLRGVIGAVPQGVSVRFAGNEAAVWGRPFVEGLMVVELSR